MIGMLRSAPSLSTTLSVKLAFVLIEKRRLRTYVTESPGSVSDCSVAQFLADGHARTVRSHVEK